MKTLFTTLGIISSIFIFTACGSLNGTSSGDGKTEGESQNSAALKKQLTTLVVNALGLDESLDSVSESAKIKIDLPTQWNDVKSYAGTVGLTDQVQKIEKNIDSVTQDLGKAAIPHLKAAIEKMTLVDALTIYNADSKTSLTDYLRNTTGASVANQVKPEVQTGLNKFGVNNLWESVAPKWNSAATLLGKEKLPTDLNQFVSDKAVDEIFKKIATEEQEFRTDDRWKKIFKK